MLFFSRPLARIFLQPIPLRLDCMQYRDGFVRRWGDDALRLDYQWRAVPRLVFAVELVGLVESRTLTLGRGRACRLLVGPESIGRVDCSSRLPEATQPKLPYGLPTLADARAPKADMLPRERVIFRWHRFLDQSFL